MKKFSFISFVFLFVTACQPLSPVVFFVGQPPESATEHMVVVDEQGQAFDFTNIADLEVDSQGNLYVYDFGKIGRSDLLAAHAKARILKVTPEGQVTPLIGRGTEQKLVGSTAMTVRSDVLYAVSTGCVLQANLRNTPVVFSRIYGECLSSDEVKRIEEDSKDKAVIEKTYIATTGLQYISPQEIYFSGTLFPKSRVIYILIPTSNKVQIFEPSSQELINLRFYGNAMAFDSSGRAYSIDFGDPSLVPERAENLLIRSSSLETTQEKGFERIHIHKELNYPVSVTVDAKDYLYVRDEEGDYKQISPQGEIKHFAQLDMELFDAQGGIRADIVNPERSLLYFATETALYKIPLPASNTRNVQGSNQDE